MADQDKFRIAFAGGGSGGHVYPLLAVLEVLQKRFNELALPYEIYRIGPRDGYDTLFENRGVVISSILGGKIRRYASLSNFTDIPKFFIGFLQALFKLFFIMPDALFSKGGTGAFPVVVAAWFYRIPVIIHESDAEPGLTNLASARFAKKVFVGFPRAAKFFASEKTGVVGIPVRKELLVEQASKALAKEALGFDSSRFLTLVLGGSQGATRINEFILTNLAEITKYAQVLHQTGIGNVKEAEQLSHAALIDEPYKSRYQAVGYFEKNLGTALAAADLAISRAGGSAITEISAFGVPMILVPLPESANDHQRANAYELSKIGAAIVVEEANLLPGIFLGELKKLFEDSALREKMSVAAKGFFMPDAAEKIAEALISVGMKTI